MKTLDSTCIQKDSDTIPLSSLFDISYNNSEEEFALSFLSPDKY